ncbi:unnamed protein product [Ixodes persulcatus]
MPCAARLTVRPTTTKRTRAAPHTGLNTPHVKALLFTTFRCHVEKCYIGQTGRCVNDRTREHAASVRPLQQPAIFQRIVANANVPPFSLTSPSWLDTKNRSQRKS